MKAIVKRAVITGAGALFLGTNLALSSATVVSSATRAHPGAKSETCNVKSTCFTVSNTGVGGSAIAGVADTGYGVWGVSSNNIGVYGESSGADGVEGDAQGSNAGVYGDAQGAGAGVFGQSASGSAGSFENDTGKPTLYVANGAADGPILNSINTSTESVFNVDNFADGIFSGSVTASSFITEPSVRGGPRLEAFGSESTRATIEDTGTARLEAGEGAVRFDSAFASTIDAARGYQVFLTPDGETRGWLYVAEKYEGGFIVREGLHGRSSVYFDYRVVAHPYGASDARLPQLQIKRPPIPHLPQHPQPRQP